MAQRLDHLEDDRVAQSRIRGIQAAFDHDPLRQLARRHLARGPEMQRTELGNLALLEEAVADEISRLLILRLGEQPDRRVHVRKVVLGRKRSAGLMVARRLMI